MEDSKKMSIKDGLKIIEDADIKKVIEEIKKDTKIYERYKSFVKNKGPKESENLLAVLCTIKSLTNEKFSLLVTSVSMDILFYQIDCLMREEIIPEGENHVDED